MDKNGKEISRNFDESEEIEQRETPFALFSKFFNGEIIKRVVWDSNKQTQQKELKTKYSKGQNQGFCIPL